MNSKVKKALDRLDNNLRQTLEYMDGLSEEKLYQAPTDAWNGAQILHHIYQSEMGVAAYVTKKMMADRKEIGKTGFSGLVRSYLLNRALKNYAKKFRVPSSLAPVPEKPYYAETKANFLENRRKISELLGKFDGDMVSRGYFKHPRAGRLNIVQTLSFMNEHMERHSEQIRERSA